MNYFIYVYKYCFIYVYEDYYSLFNYLILMIIDILDLA